jgi:hypothetical protein
MKSTIKPEVVMRELGIRDLRLTDPNSNPQQMLVIRIRPTATNAISPTALLAVGDCAVGELRLMPSLGGAFCQTFRLWNLLQDTAWAISVSSSREFVYSRWCEWLPELKKRIHTSNAIAADALLLDGQDLKDAAVKTVGDFAAYAKRLLNAAATTGDNELVCYSTKYDEDRLLRRPAILLESRCKSEMQFLKGLISEAFGPDLFSIDEQQKLRAHSKNVVTLSLQHGNASTATKSRGVATVKLSISGSHADIQEGRAFKPSPSS